MNVPIQQAFVEGVGYTGLQSPERKKCLAHGHEVGHQEYKCDSKVTNSMGRLCSYPPSFMRLPQKQIQLCKALLSKVDFTEYFVGEQAGELHRILWVDSSCHVVTPSPSLPTDSPQCLQGLWLQWPSQFSQPSPYLLKLMRSHPDLPRFSTRPDTDPPDAAEGSTSPPSPIDVKKLKTVNLLPFLSLVITKSDSSHHIAHCHYGAHPGGSRNICCL